MRKAGSSFVNKKLYQNLPFPPRVPPALHRRGSRCGSCRHCTEEEKAARSKNLHLSLPPEVERLADNADLSRSDELLVERCRFGKLYSRRVQPNKLALEKSHPEACNAAEKRLTIISAGPASYMYYMYS